MWPGGSIGLPGLWSLSGLHSWWRLNGNLGSDSGDPIAGDPLQGSNVLMREKRQTLSTILE